MEKIQVIAPAKLNLYLDIVEKKSNGYHNMNMIMQSIDLCDRIIIEKIHDYTINLVSDGISIPDEDNIAYKAAVIFYSRCMQKFTGVNITIEKKIPVQAGMGGGSSDAAGVLIGLNGVENTNFGEEDLCNLGAQLGADVPFALVGGTCAVTGIGDELQKLAPLDNVYFIIAKPKTGISTAEAFKKYDDSKIKMRGNFSQMIAAVDNQDLDDMKKYMQNAFEIVCNVADMAKCKKAMMESGAEFALMTGSGSAVFGIFKDMKKAKEAIIKVKFVCDEIYVARPIDQGAYIPL